MNKINMCMCNYCIEEIKSRGEIIYVGNQASDNGKCGWCDEENVETYYVTMEQK